MEEESKFAEEGIEKLFGDGAADDTKEIAADFAAERNDLTITTSRLDGENISFVDEPLSIDQKEEIENIANTSYDGIGPRVDNPNANDVEPGPIVNNAPIAPVVDNGEGFDYEGDQSEDNAQARCSFKKVLAVCLVGGGCLVGGVVYYISTVVKSKEAKQPQDKKAGLAAVAKLSKFIAAEYLSLQKQIQTAKNAGKLSKTFNFEGTAIPYGPYFLGAVKPPFTQFSTTVGFECAKLQGVSNPLIIASLVKTALTAGGTLITALEKLQSNANIAIVMKLADITFPISTIQGLIADINNAS